MNTYALIIKRKYKMSNVITFCMTDNSRCNIMIHGEHDVGKGAIKVFLLLNKLAAVAIK